MLQSYVAPSVPIPGNDGGWKIFGISWRYIMRFDGVLSNGFDDVVPVYPVDPRLPDSGGDYTTRKVLNPNEVSLVRIG